VPHWAVPLDLKKAEPPVLRVVLAANGVVSPGGVYGSLPVIMPFEIRKMLLS